MEKNQGSTEVVPQRTRRRSRLTKSRRMGSADWTSDGKSGSELDTKTFKKFEEGKQSEHTMKSELEEKASKFDGKLADIESNGIVKKTTDHNVVKPFRDSEASQSSFRKKLGFFRRSITEKLKNVESPVEVPPQTINVVVDVHCENEVKKSRIPLKVQAKSKENGKNIEDTTNIDEIQIQDSLDLIEEFKDDKNVKKATSGFFKSSDESSLNTEIEAEDPLQQKNGLEDGQIFESSPRRRKRWDKSESAVDLVDTLQGHSQPGRKRWIKETNSTERNRAKEKGKAKMKKSATTRQDDTKMSKSLPRSKSKSFMKKGSFFDYDNQGYTTDREEVLRIETEGNEKPKIKMTYASENEIEPESEDANNDDDPQAKLDLPEIPDRVDIDEIPEIENNIDSLSLISSEDEEIKRTTHRKKSKIRRKTSESDVDVLDEDNDDERKEEEKRSPKAQAFAKRSTSEEVSTSTTDQKPSRSKSKSTMRSDDIEEISKVRKKRAKRRSRSEARAAVESVKKKSKKKTREKKWAEDEEKLKYISVKVHRSDMLEMDYVTRHPMVKVHIVNADSGHYLSIRDNHGARCGRLQPIITGTFDFKKNKSMVAVWEEELIFEYDFKTIEKDYKQAVLILFEIVDLLTFSEASLIYDNYGRDGCWYNIAWAFLRPVGSDGTKHIGKKLRLQLYRPKRDRKKGSQKCEVYSWWKSGVRKKYESSLFVTIGGVDPPKLEPVVYEQLALNDLNDNRSESQKDITSSQFYEDASFSKWTRLAAQSCQIPNETLFETEVCENGCFSIAFSNHGKYLACAVSEEYDYPIIVYKFDEWKIFVKFSGHKNFIYNLSWSSDDRFILSVSSDQTARFWDVREQIIEHIQMLPHPSYVYCGIFLLESSAVVVTGCYDHTARVWVRNNKGHELLQELDAHEGFVNSLCFQKDGSLLTADSLGIVILWALKKTRRSPIKKEWHFKRKIKVDEIEGAPINTIALHPLGSRLLVHSRKNKIVLLDIASGAVLRRYEGLKNQRIQTKACISPCGSLVLCGGDDSTLSIWNLESGKQMARYEVDPCTKAVTCVDYHPYDHALAYSTFGSPSGVKILKFDRDADGSDVGLKLVENVNSVNSIPGQNSSSYRDGLKQHLSTGRTSTGRISTDPISAQSLISSMITSQGESTRNLLAAGDNHEVRDNLRIKLQKFIESGPSLRTRSMNRLNSIIEKIDRILINAGSKSPAFDLQCHTNPIFTIDDSRISSGSKRSGRPLENGETSVQPEVFEMQDFSTKRKTEKMKKERSKSAKSLRSRIREKEALTTFSDSAAHRKHSKYSDESNSNLSRFDFDDGRPLVRDKFRFQERKGSKIDRQVNVPRELDKIQSNYQNGEQIDTGSSKSDDTYVVESSIKGKLSGESLISSSSGQSNATFVIENDRKRPVPMPRKKIKHL